MATYKKINVDIGLESDFTKLPAEVKVGDWSYFLARSRKGIYQLLSNVCPHQAEEVVDWTGVFHSYLTVMREQALADARQAEQDIGAGRLYRGDVQPERPVRVAGRHQPSGPERRRAPPHNPASGIAAQRL